MDDIKYTKTNCDCCGSQFLSVSGNKQNGKGRRYCSPKCKRDSFNRHDKWATEEIEELKRLLELMPKMMAVHNYRDNAQSKRWRKRTHVAVWRKSHVLGEYAVSAKREYYTATELARTLNIHKARIKLKWREQGLQHNYCIGEKTHVYSIYAIKKYAANRPRDFYGIPVKKLNIIFRDLAFSKEIFELAFADSFSSCFCIVRLQGGVFESVGDAADKLVLGKSTVEKNVVKEAPINIRGQIHDLIKLNYPIYLAPEGYEKEFNELAGNILINLYAEYKLIEGYSKLLIQVISVRQAVNIALVAFRSYFQDKSLGIKERSVKSIAKYWQDVYVKTFIKHYNINSYVVSRKRVYEKLKYRAYDSFVNCYGDRSEFFFAEFVDDFISKYGNVYFRDQYLPVRQFQNRYIAADIWLFIECIASATLKKSKGLFLAKAQAYAYIRKHQPNSNYNPDWIEHADYHSNNDSTKEIGLIIEGLDCLNLEETYKDLCNQYVQAFCVHADAYEVRRQLGISVSLEKEIIETLRLASMPF